MMINTNSMVSITEANQNFSRVAKIVDKTGSAIILKNNVPKYVIIEYKQLEKDENVNDKDLLSVSQKFIEKNREAYEVLAEW